MYVRYPCRTSLSPREVNYPQLALAAHIRQSRPWLEPFLVRTSLKLSKKHLSVSVAMAQVPSWLDSRTPNLTTGAEGECAEEDHGKRDEGNPSTLHPAPYTLNLGPCTLKPEPHTPHPTPHTPHPTPSTLNPPPSALSPEP